MKKYDSLEIARIRKGWDDSASSSNHDPVEALFMALDAIGNEEIVAEHIFVCVALRAKEDDAIGLRYYSAGPFGLRETVGLLEEAKVNLFENSEK